MAGMDKVPMPLGIGTDLGLAGILVSFEEAGNGIAAVGFRFAGICVLIDASFGKWALFAIDSETTGLLGAPFKIGLGTVVGIILATTFGVL